MNIKSTIVCGVAVIALTGLMTGCQHPPTSNGSPYNHPGTCSNNPYLMKYDCSITRIQEAAENGSADAQYALGYMYYYGIDTVKDRQTAELWIQRSAAQGQPLAKKAWSLINSGATFTDLHRAASEPSPATRGVGDTIVQQESVDVNKMNSVVPSAPITSELPAYQAAPSDNQSTTSNSTTYTPPLSENHPKSINDPRLSSHSHPVVASITKDAAATATSPAVTTPVKVASNTQGEYTIQLMGSDQLSDVKAFTSAHHLGNKAHYYRTQMHGKSWYMLTYGQYPTATQAEAALQKLPENLQNHHPWVKAFATVQKEVQMQKLNA